MSLTSVLQMALFFVELYTYMLHLFSGAFSIPTHGCLVRPIRSAIILLTVHIQSLAPIGSGGCAAVHSLPSIDFRILFFLKEKTDRICLETSFSHQFPLSNLHLKPVSLQWNLRHFAARKLLTQCTLWSKTRQLNKVALSKESCTRTITGKYLRFKAISQSYLQLTFYKSMHICSSIDAQIHSCGWISS